MVRRQIYSTTRLTTPVPLTLIAVFTISLAFAQHPLKDPADAVDIRYSSCQPVVGYTLTIRANDLTRYEIEMRIRNVRDTFRVAMAAHPEYDDRFWRFVKDLRVETKNGRADVVREDSAVWRVIAPGGEVALHYSIHLPAPQEGLRAAWRPFLSPTGGLVGGPHSFMYVVGSSLAPSYVTLNLPPGWMAATGLESTLDQSTFFAPSTGVLVDSPFLVGYFKSWPFSVDQVPHRIIYWSLPGAVAFDTATLVSDVKRVVQQSNTLFGRLPYREYSFLFQDGAYGALEHGNSVTLGIPRADLAKNVASYLSEIGHEYFHAWNLVRIHPVEQGDVNYKTPALSRGLWWSEGLTMFYADLLLRRAGLPLEDSTRTRHLESLMSWYLGNPGNHKISAENSSLASNGPPGMLGDYDASTHLQGELIGTVLDLIIRDATDGKKSIDDVMRRMMERFSGAQGFSSKDIENLVAETCGCTVHSFFEDHVYGSKSIDFNHYLALAGLSSNVKWKDASGEDGKPHPDRRVYAFDSRTDKTVRLGITDPGGCWGRAGLHTGDIIVSVNNLATKNANDFRRFARTVRIEDKVLLEIKRPAGILNVNVLITGYQQPIVHIEEIKNVTDRQRRLRNVWMNGF